jgi:AraC family transcriptional regulator
MTNGRCRLMDGVVMLNGGYYAWQTFGNPRASITEIGFALGFSGTSAFSATFHRITGQTPTDYRRTLE